MRDLSNSLRALVEVEGVQAAFIVDSTGLLIDSHSREDMDLEAVGALVSRGMDCHESLFKELRTRCLSWAVLKGDPLSVLVRGLSRDAWLGLVMRESSWLDQMGEQADRWAPVSAVIQDWGTATTQTLGIAQNRSDIHG